MYVILGTLREGMECGDDAVAGILSPSSGNVAMPLPGGAPHAYHGAVAEVRSLWRRHRPLPNGGLRSCEARCYEPCES
jgi:hypothetical protein